MLLSVMYAVGLTILAGLEQATDGWGVGGRMFTAAYFGGADIEWWMRLPIFFFILLFFFFVGAAVATVYVRWRATCICTSIKKTAFSFPGRLSVKVRSPHCTPRDKPRTANPRQVLVSVTIVKLRCRLVESHSFNAVNHQKAGAHG